MSRALDEIRRVRDEKQGADLLEQLLWRIKLLGGEVDLIDAVNREAFADVLDAFVPDSHELILQANQECSASERSGGYIQFTGYLVSGGNTTAELERRLYLGEGSADHRRFRLVPRVVPSLRQSPTLAPTIEQLGVASVGDLDAEALLDQMRSGTQANESLVVAQFQFGAWSRV